MRSPTSRVGYIEAEGMDLGSAREDLNSILTLKAVKAAFASSEQILYSFENQVPFDSFKSLDTVTSLLRLATVPPLSTSVLAGAAAAAMSDSLQGNHFDPCRKGTIDARLRGETPWTPEDEPDEDFISEINPTTKGDAEFPPRISSASVEYIDVLDAGTAGEKGLAGLGRRKSGEVLESGFWKNRERAEQHSWKNR